MWEAMKMACGKLDFKVMWRRLVVVFQETGKEKCKSGS